MAKISTSDLKAMLASEKADALAAISAARLAEDRADAMDYYLGDMGKDMPAQDGRSRAVSTDVADTIEGLMPSLMDIFAGSDEVVRFEPVGPEDEAAAQQETDYVNHVFMQQNPGFMILYSFIKDALLSPRASSARCGLVSRRRWKITHDGANGLATINIRARSVGRCTKFAKLMLWMMAQRIHWSSSINLYSSAVRRFRISIMVIGGSLSVIRCRRRLRALFLQRM